MPRVMASANDLFGINSETDKPPFFDLVNDFNVLGFPTTLFFDKNHKLSKKWTGYLDEENLIEQLKKRHSSFFIQKLCHI